MTPDAIVADVLRLPGFEASLLSGGDECAFPARNGKPQIILARQNGEWVVTMRADDFVKMAGCNPKGRNEVVERIINLVCQEYIVTREDIMGRHRPDGIAEARHVIVWLCSQFLPSASLTMIGRIFGRVHGTASNSIKAVNDLMETNKKFKERLMVIRDKLSKEFGGKLSHKA